MKKYETIVIGEVVIILAFLLLILFSSIFNQENLTDASETSPTFAIVPDVSDVIPQITPNPITTIVTSTSDCVPSVSQITGEDECFAEITIYTDNKTKTYEIMPDVHEDTLKDNIGWLPSSSLPYEDGACILMGHRDTDFRILKYCEVGNDISIILGDLIYNYSVSHIEIVDSNDLLKFNTNPDYSLILVTCYPFYYSGHAPKKILFYCTRK